MKNILLLITLLFFAVSDMSAQVFVTGQITRTNGDTLKQVEVYIRADSSSGPPAFSSMIDTTNNTGLFDFRLPNSVPNGTVFYVSTLSCDSVSEVFNTHVFTGGNINSPLIVCVSPQTNFSGYVFLGDDTKRPPQQQAEVLLISKCAGTTLTYVDTVETDTNGYYEVSAFPVIGAGCQLIMQARLKPTATEYQKYLPAYHQTDSTYKLRWFNANDISLQRSKTGVNITLPEAINPFGGPSVISGYAVDNKGNIAADKILFITDNLDIPVAYTYTDAMGVFAFDNLQFGRYKLFGDVWGKDNPKLVVKVDADEVEVHPVIFTESGTEFAGRIATSVTNTTGIFKDVALFPNPAKSIVYVQGTEKIDTDKKVVVSNSVGTVVHSVSFLPNEQVKINVAHLPAGVYTVQLLSENGGANIKLQIQ